MKKSLKITLWVLVVLAVLGFPAGVIPTEILGKFAGVEIIGKTVRILVDGKDGDQLTGRTEGGRLVRFAGCESLIGTYQNLKITGSTTWSLTGELAE